jgi:hypothetical protein
LFGEADQLLSIRDTPEGLFNDDQKQPVTLERLYAVRARRLAILKRRQQPIIEGLRQKGEWVSLADIADWCAREAGGIRPDENLRAEAYRQLGESLAAGFFGRGRQSRVLFLHPHSTWAKMTQDRYRNVPFGQEGRRGYLRWCWIPRGLAQTWFEAKNIRCPVHLFPDTRF